MDSLNMGFFFCVKEMSRSRGTKNAGMKIIEVFLGHYKLAKLSS